MCVWIHFPSPSQMPFPSPCWGLQQCSVLWDRKMRVIGLLGLTNYLQSTGFTVRKDFFFHSIGQILDALYVYKPPFQQLWKDILNFKWEPCSQDILPTRFQSKHHVERKEVTWNRHLGVATFPQPCRDSGSRQGPFCVSMVHFLNSLYVWKPGITWYSG